MSKELEQKRNSDLYWTWAPPTDPIACRLLFCAEHSPLYAYRGKIERAQFGKILKRFGAASHSDLFPLSGTDSDVHIKGTTMTLELQKGSIDIQLEEIPLYNLTQEELQLVKKSREKFLKDVIAK